ncbi:PTS transporter subunit EIIC [Oceanobacillus sp. CFH 90083]|uniref:PTS transporter subunit EIIC n=1 Tax=Oceanobacillus sp. CFH 90083 TaxID=2592336 RepID=UPI00128E2EE2|nr:PTS transporter subunit EIIC [Oceanobacillus sp. CFH 90083]
MKKTDYGQMANEIIQNVGGKENISHVTHCMTRLRFNLKDESLADTDKLKEVNGVLGTTQSGGQFQIIIGQNVEKVYDQLSVDSDHASSPSASDEKEAKKEKFSFKRAGNKILDGLAGSLTPLIPVLVAASMFKMLTAVLGPTMLGIISEESSLFILFNFVGDAGFYFFPVMLGYTACKKFGSNPVLGMFLGGILIHPTLLGFAEAGEKFSVYGIPATPENYTSTVIPIILSAWVMSYIEKNLKKVIPATLATILVPTLTIMAMLPIALVVLGPAGFFAGNYISTFLLSLDSIGGFLAVAIIAALWQFLVMTGMHLLMITTLITVFAQNGQESIVGPAAIIASICVAGMSLGTFLRLRNKNEKALSFSFFIASFIGGVTEPALYGLGVRYRKPFIGLMIGGFAGGLYAGITGVTNYALIPVANFISMTGFFGGTTANAVNGLLACSIGFVVTAVITYALGVQQQTQKKEESGSDIYEEKSVV